MSDTIAPAAPVLPLSATLKATADKIGATLAQTRATLQAKRDEVEDYYLNAARGMADQAMAGASIVPPKDSGKLQQQVDMLFATVRVLEADHVAAVAAAHRAKERELGAEADAIHAEFTSERLRLLSIIIAATARLVKFTQRSLPEYHVLYRNGEHVMSLMEAQNPAHHEKLSALRTEAENIGSGGCVSTQLDHSPFPTPEHIAAAHALLANI